MSTLLSADYFSKYDKNDQKWPLASNFKSFQGLYLTSKGYMIYFFTKDGLKYITEGCKCD